MEVVEKSVHCKGLDSGNGSLWSTVVTCFFQKGYCTSLCGSLGEWYFYSVLGSKIKSNNYFPFSPAYRKIMTRVNRR